WTGMSAFIILIYHVYLAIDLYGFNLGITKVFSGLFGLIILTGIVIFGWLRWFKASYIKRMIHLWLGLLLFFLIIVHVLIYFICYNELNCLIGGVINSLFTRI